MPSGKCVGRPLFSAFCVLQLAFGQVFVISSTFLLHWPKRKMQLKRREGKQTSGRQGVHIKFVILAQGPSLYLRGH